MIRMHGAIWGGGGSRLQRNPGGGGGFQRGPEGWSVGGKHGSIWQNCVFIPVLKGFLTLCPI